jgi:glycosyltransferase involved in cell wall biosynthesis
MVTSAVDRPDVSVVIPVRNGEAFVADAVRSALDQEGVACEVVVVNDASTDGTLAALAGIGSPRLRVIDLPGNVGGAAARNLGVAEARADVLAFLDADDLFLPGKLRQQLARLPPEDGARTLVASAYRDHRGVAVSPTGFGRHAVERRAVLTRACEVPTSGWLLRRAHFLATGGFAVGFPRHQDVEFLVRFLADASVTVVERPLFRKRQFRRARAGDVERAVAAYGTQFAREIAALAPDDRRALAARSDARIATLLLLERKPLPAARALVRAAATAPVHTGRWLSRPLLRRLNGHAAAPVATGSRLRIMGYPAFANRRRNPLNALLYERLAALGAEVHEFGLWRGGPAGVDVLHVHWPDLLMTGRLPFQAQARTRAFLHRLREHKAAGASLFWTVHNVMPHEAAASALRQRFWPCFLRQLDGLIFLTETSRGDCLAAMPELAPIPHAVIRRGHFRPVLGRLPDRAAARARLGLPGEGRVLLNFGQVRAYKNLPVLLRAFLALDRPDALLVVAGEVKRGSGLGEELTALAAGRASVRLDLRFIPDETLALYLAAADLVVLPYRNILNSAGLLMALSAARPTLCPRQGSIGEIADEVGGGWVRTYDGPFTAAHLAAALDAPAPPSAEPDLGRFDWDLIARQHLDFFGRVAGR